MQVTLSYDGEELTHVCDAGSTIREILGEMGIHPSTVLAVHDGVIVPHDSVINSDISLETVIVSSGG